MDGGGFAIVTVDEAFLNEHLLDFRPKFSGRCKTFAIVSTDLETSVSNIDVSSATKNFRQ